ncbi:MAG: hypothetical protein ACTS7E_03050 [Arsenophonus sp. NC-CH8-MAG3]
MSLFMVICPQPSYKTCISDLEIKVPKVRNYLSTTEYTSATTSYTALSEAKK